MAEVEKAQRAILADARARVTELHRDTLATDRERDLLTETLVGRVYYGLKDELG